jgi:hypothetical protein
VIDCERDKTAARRQNLVVAERTQGQVGVRYERGTFVGGDFGPCLERWGEN